MRGVSAVLGKDLSAISRRYSEESLARLDKRSRGGRVLATRVVAFTAEVQRFKADNNLPTELTPAELSLCRKAAYLDELLDNYDAPLEANVYSQTLNSFLGVMRQLRLPRPGRRLSHRPLVSSGVAA